MTKNKMTFSDLYKAELAKPAKSTYAQDFINKIAEVTMKSAGTVHMWLYSDQRPDALTQKILADYLKTTPETLFPKS